MSSVPSVSESGNTKHSLNAHKRFCFTIFNRTNEDPNWLLCRLVPKCKKFVFQLEKTKEGRLHWQGCLTLLKKERLTGVKKWLDEGAHLEKTRSAVEAELYCQKKDSRVAGPWRHGKVALPEVEDEEEFAWTRWAHLRKFQKEVEDLVKSAPDERSIYWYWEDNGNTGKTTFCKYLYHKYKVSVSTSGMNERDLFHIVSEEKPKCLIIDLPREEQAKTLRLGPVEQVKNGFFGTGKYEGHSYCGPNPHVIIFANRPPYVSEFKNLSEDRWKIRNIDSEMLAFIDEALA